MIKYSDNSYRALYPRGDILRLLPSGCRRRRPLFGKANLRGTQNAEAILRTYHHSRLWLPSPSLSRPLSSLPTPFTEEVADGRTDRGEFLSISPRTYGASMLYSRSSPSVLSRSFRTRSLPPCFLPRPVSQTWKLPVGAPQNDRRHTKKCSSAYHRLCLVARILGCALLRGKVFQTLKIHDIPDRAPKRSYC